MNDANLTKEASFNLGVIYDDKKDFNNAEKYYKLAEELGSQEASHNLGLLYRDNQYFSEAINSFENANKNNINPYITHLEKGKTYLDWYYYALANNNKTKEELNNIAKLKRNAIKELKYAKVSIKNLQGVPKYKKEQIRYELEKELEFYDIVLGDKKVDLSNKTMEDYVSKLKLLKNKKIINSLDYKEIKDQIDDYLNFNPDVFNKDIKIETFPSSLTINKVKQNKTNKENKYKPVRFDKYKDYSNNVTNINKALEYVLSEVFLNVYNKFKEKVLYTDNPKYKQRKKFEIGSLYDISYDKTTPSIEIKQIDEDVLKFLDFINVNYKNNKVLKLKFVEFVKKIELYRIIVRNVSSHKEHLYKEAFEDGLNLFFFEENSIIDLMCELFGDYFLKKNELKEDEKLFQYYLENYNKEKYLEEIDENII